MVYMSYFSINNGNYYLNRAFLSIFYCIFKYRIPVPVTWSSSGHAKTVLKNCACEHL